MKLWKGCQKAPEKDHVNMMKWWSKMWKRKDFSLLRAQAAQLWGHRTSGICDDVEFFEPSLSNLGYFFIDVFVEEVGMIQETVCNMFLISKNKVK